ncbi:MAG TPA: TraR/DksA C4-type zinc finger protein [Gemmatales bacterium]|nr:TraR/DksA C4-type zinc finger protein [Gemmatales bacterium]
MTKATREKYRQQLLTLAKEVGRESVHLKDEAVHPLAELSGQFSEKHNEQAELGVTISLLNNEESLSSEIKSALQRIDDGTFGICMKCQKSITQERLNAIPYTPYCIQCA